MTSPRVPPVLQRAAREMEPALAAALQRVAGQAPPRLLEAMRYALLGGGKRLRPALVWATCEGLGRPVGHPDVEWACVLEMVHTYSLIHDDLPAMDDDDLRRGRPTCHKVFGEALAILAGDALLTDAFALAPNCAPRLVDGQWMVRELSKAAGSTGMVGGQVDDVLGQPRTLADLQSMHARKTGALIRAACRGPALFDEREVLQAMTTYGEQVGLAFQIADDLLDVAGDAATTGKAVSKDAGKGRVTYPGLLGAAGAKRAAQEAAEAACAALVHLPGDSGSLEALARYTVRRRR